MVVFFNFYPVMGLKVGEKSPATYTAPRTAFYIDKARTEELKKLAENMVLPVYSLNHSKTLEILSTLSANLELISQVRDQEITLEEKKDLLSKYVSILNDYETTHLLNLREGAFKAFSLTTHLLLKQVLEDGVKLEAVEHIGETVRSAAIHKEIPIEEADIMMKLASFLIREPNMVQNEVATEQRRIEAREAVTDVKNIIYRGEVILKVGEIVTEQHQELLIALGLIRKPRGLLDSPYIFILYLTLLGGGYWKLSKRDTLLKGRPLNDWVIISLSLLVIFFSYLIKQTPFEYHMLPLLSAAVLISIATDHNTGFLFLLANLGVLLLIFPLKGVELGLTIVGLSSGLIFLGKSRHRAELVFLAFITFFSIFFLFLPYKLYEGFTLIYSAQSSLTMAISAGSAYLIALLFLPFLERYLKILTPFRLLELADSDQPLLKRLLMEAPGTYHHSQVVATLSEHTASSINSDSLLCKVGGLYHDIGKISHPLFYSENQFSSESIHNKISPALSAKVITTHPQVGVEIGNKVNLPPQVLNIIASHHGTFLANYFFTEASLRETNPKEEIYRYPGPKPSSKEAVIIMLADACEATIRSLSEINPTKVKEVIENLIKERIEDGQLDESLISSKDLKIVKETLIDNLLTLYHGRLDYGQYNP